MGKKVKSIAECKHPNSRKTKALAKQIKKESNRDKIKLGNAIKQNVIAEKIAWFKQHCELLQQRQQTKNITICSHDVLKQMIESYLNRFNDELEQIKLKRSIGMRKNNRQHASREDVINMTIQRETNEYETCGIELPDLLSPTNFQTVMNWNGELRFLQNIKLKRFSKKFLELNC